MVSFGTVLLVCIGGFNPLAAVVTSQAGILPIDFHGDGAPLVIVRIIRLLIRFPYCGFLVCARGAKDAAISAHVIEGITSGPCISWQVAVFIALRLHSAPPFCSMPAFRIRSAAAK